MSEPSRQAHWQNVYATKAENEVSWFQESPAISLELIRAAGAPPRTSVIDVGGGASRLADALIEDGYEDVTVLDVSEAALSTAQSRLGPRAARVSWLVADATTWEPSRLYDVWHDRAAFHFLTESADRSAYVERLRRAVLEGGTAIIGTFAMDGPERCSGLRIVRYDAKSLGETLGNSFALVRTSRHDHITPMGGTQRFQFSVFRRQ
jgi:ubiquinone/menaquinone biosynthesis C-methylase UbiE